MRISDLQQNNVMVISEDSVIDKIENDIMLMTGFEQLEYLNKLERRIDENILSATTNVAKKAWKGAKKAVKTVADKVSVSMSDDDFLSVYKKWYKKTQTIIDEYEKLFESEEIEEPLNNYFKLLIRSSEILNDDDLFFSSNNVSVTDFNARILLLAKEYDYNLIDLLYNLNIKNSLVKKYLDGQKFYMFVGLINKMLLTIKNKKLIQPNEDNKKFMTNFVMPMIKNTRVLHQEINRETVRLKQSSKESNKQTPPTPSASSEPSNYSPEKSKDIAKPKVVTTPKTVQIIDTKLLDKYKSEYNSLDQSLNSLKPKMKETIYKAIEEFDVDPEKVEWVIKENDFLENGKSIRNKIKYISDLIGAGFETNDIADLTTKIVDHGLEEELQKNIILKDLKTVKDALSNGRFDDLLDKAFNEMVL